MAVAAGPWSIVVPVKRLVEAKTRLMLPAPLRMDVALAMTLDTVGAAMACPLVAAVVAVCDDERAASELRHLGARVVADEPDAGLNPALVHGASATEPGGHVAALSADLPALRSGDLAAVLSAAARLFATTNVCAVVADAAGSGTTLLAAAGPDELRPSFGPQSFRAHVAAGAADLTARAGESLRRDVDTLDDLRDAVRLGVGAATADLLRRHPDLLVPAGS